MSEDGVLIVKNRKNSNSVPYFIISTVHFTVRDIYCTDALNI